VGGSTGFPRLKGERPQNKEKGGPRSKDVSGRDERSKDKIQFVQEGGGGKCRKDYSLAGEGGG